MNADGVAALAAIPWAAVPATIIWRVRRASTLDSYAPAIPAAAPLVSIIVPARDEARNIEPCVRSILAGTWTNVEVIVVNDHSGDATGRIARTVAESDARVRVLENPGLPDGWIGKQWACHNGARLARGDFLLFTDADTRHGPELLARSMNAMVERGADLFTVAGAQTMETFWERLLQPHVFGMIVARFGDTDRMNRSKDPFRKIANGQFMLLRRSAYDRTGGHEAVRTHVAEDLRMAQEWTRHGYSVQIIAAFDHMSTRMYEGFGEIWRGWGKNIWAAGRDTIEAGPATKSVMRVLAPFVPLWEVAPFAAVVLWFAGAVPAAVALWGAIAYACNTLFWALMHVAFRAPVGYAALNPLAGCVLSGLIARASWRGPRVEWKGRSYLSR